MWMLVSPFLIALALGSATLASAQSQARLSVAVEGVRNDSGSVRCGLYSSADGFREPPGFNSAAFTYNGGTLQLPVQLTY